MISIVTIVIIIVSIIIILSIASSITITSVMAGESTFETITISTSIRIDGWFAFRPRPLHANIHSEESSAVEVFDGISCVSLVFIFDKRVAFHYLVIKMILKNANLI